MSGPVRLTRPAPSRDAVPPTAAASGAPGRGGGDHAAPFGKASFTRIDFLPIADQRDNHGPAIPGAADYIYPHNLPERIAAQQYLPDALLETRYYEPGAIGAEGAIAERLARIRQILDSAPRPPKQP